MDDYGYGNMDYNVYGMIMDIYIYIYTWKCMEHTLCSWKVLLICLGVGSRMWIKLIIHIMSDLFFHVPNSYYKIWETYLSLYRYTYIIQLISISCLCMFYTYPQSPIYIAVHISIYIYIHIHIATHSSISVIIHHYSYYP